MLWSHEAFLSSQLSYSYTLLYHDLLCFTRMDHNLHLNPTPTSILLGSTHLNPTLIQDPMAHLQTQAYYPSFSGKSMSEFPFPEPKSQIFFFQKLFSMHFKLPCSVYSLNIRCISNWPTSHMLDLHTPKSLCPLMLVRFDYSYTNPLFLFLLLIFKPH